jgi:MFS family permease
MSNPAPDLNVAGTVPWWQEISKKQWYVLYAGVLGWALDAFDVMLYAFALTSILKEWSLSTTVAGLLASVTLFSSAFGGIAFGAIADAIGRKRALMVTVLIYSLCSGLSGLAQNVVQLAIARTILGLGMGGEWAAGALLVSETWPARHRGKAIGFMQSGWAIGYLLAAVTALYVLPAYGWRALFFVGVLPALFTVWVRSYVDEPEIWVKKQQTGQTSGGLSQAIDSFLAIFKADLIKYTVIITLMSSFVMFAYWGLFTWLPGFLATPVEKGGAGLGLVRSSAFMIPMMLGAFLGYVTFGFFADRLGRRPTFAAYLLISAVLVYFYGNTRDAATLVTLGPVLGFFGSGYFSGFGSIISEIYPTRVRGAGVGFTYNVGRAMSAMAPAVIGYFAIAYGIGGSLTITAIFFVLGALTVFLLPETKGKQLE